MPLLDLVDELLLCISENLESERDINAFSQTNSRLHNVLNTYLYRHNVQRLGSSGLWWAAQHGQEATTRKFLEEGADVQAKDQSLIPLLSRVAGKGHEAVVKLLLERGADVDSKDSYGRTPLSWAAHNGRDVVVKLLLDTRKVDVDSKDPYGRTPLSRAAGDWRDAVVKLLLDTRKVDVDWKDSYGRTPLSRAWIARSSLPKF